MAYCSSCGTQIPEGATGCPKCLPAGGAGSGTGPAATGGLADNVAGLLAYITIIPAIIFLVIEPYNKSRFVRFHAFQSIFFAVAWIVGCIALVIVSVILGLIPGIRVLVGILWPLFYLGMLIAWIMLLIKANQGQMWKLPVIGDLAEKQAGAGLPGK
jgi:uncharacterized membrane protein